MRAGEAITGDCIEPEGTYPVYGGNGIRGFTESFTHSGPQILIGRQGALCGNVHLVSGEFWASEHAIVAQARPGGCSSVCRTRWPWTLVSIHRQLPSQGLERHRSAPSMAPLPPADEQRAIADDLDRETARIDELIAEQERLLEVLTERRHAVMSSVFGAHVGAGDRSKWHIDETDIRAGDAKRPCPCCPFRSLGGCGDAMKSLTSGLGRKVCPPTRSARKGTLSTSHAGIPRDTLVSTRRKRGEPGLRGSENQARSQPRVACWCDEDVGFCFRDGPASEGHREC